MDALDRSLEVVTLLRSHGVGTQAARSVARVGEMLRRQMGDADIEFAALFDDSSGRQIGDILSGELDHVLLGPHIAAMRPGRRYVHLHTHPLSTGFTDDDFRVLLGNPPIRTSVIVGSDGTWYFLSKVRNQPTADPEEAYGLWGEEYIARYAHFDALIRSTALSEPEALCALTHDVVAAVAPALRLRYDRLEPR